MKLKNYISILCCLVCTAGYSQLAGIIHNSTEALESYTLFEHPEGGTYLIDNCGEIINSWNTNQADLHPKLLPNGNLIFIHHFGRIYEYDWEGNEVKELEVQSAGIIPVYEIIVLPNQNYLCVGREDMSPQDFIDVGYEIPGTTPTQGDVVMEIDSDTGEIVWLWRIFDHVIQDRDPAAANYGVVADNPQLLDMGRISNFDWEFIESFMINGMDYNPELDQIAISVRKMSEVVIIDHSTTTAEAAGSTGGNSGKGGDALYRFGNPENYDRGTDADQVLYYQHNPKWILHGVHKGKMTCYNNGLNNPNFDFNERYSSVPIFEPAKDANGNYIITAGQAFMPLQPELSYDKFNLGPDFFSGYTSGAEVLSNGNIFVTIGVSQRFIELDQTSGDILWDYKLGGTNGFYVFRGEKYDLDYPAFDGRDLTPQGTIEQPPSFYDCSILSNADETILDPVAYQYDLSSRVLTVKLEDYNEVYCTLYNVAGQKVHSTKVGPQNQLPRLESGLYVLHFLKQGKALGAHKIIIH